MGIFLFKPRKIIIKKTQNEKTLIFFQISIYQNLNFNQNFIDSIDILWGFKGTVFVDEIIPKTELNF